MSRLEPQEFIKNCPKDASLIGLDIGGKTIGVSVGSLLIGIASPVDTIRRKKFRHDADQIQALIKEYTIEGLVVGYPFEMSGAEGRQCQSVRDFMIELERHIECPIYTYYDERLSTAVVDGYLDNFVKKKKAKGKGLTDKLAAQVILQGFIDDYGV
ncbi:MAG: Holliday junction resolvase RuvX [Alphaproteobacteria bacterium]|nr:Holliday junction resolvase RuvX [Alphaproteobacteria bacterium]